MARVKQAIYFVAAVEVCCPECGAAQPSPDTGSDFWDPRDVRGHGQRSCVDCDATFIVDPPKSARWPTWD